MVLGLLTTVVSLVAEHRQEGAQASVVVERSHQGRPLETEINVASGLLITHFNIIISRLYDHSGEFNDTY